MAWYHLGIRQGKHRVGRQAQRQIDGLLRLLGQCLCLFLRAGVHQLENLLRLGGDDLRHDLLLRVDEVGLQLRAVA